MNLGNAFERRKWDSKTASSVGSNRSAEAIVCDAGSLLEEARETKGSYLQGPRHILRGLLFLSPHCGCLFQLEVAVFSQRKL